jgi:hypothetical protein
MSDDYCRLMKQLAPDIVFLNHDKSYIIQCCFSSIHLIQFSMFNIKTSFNSIEYVYDIIIRFLYALFNKKYYYRLFIS